MADGRWITLTEDHLKATGYGTIVDRARTLAVGDIDPVGRAIVRVTARVRRAVRLGNALDTDETKIPASLEEAASLLALAALAGRIGLPLDEDMRTAVADARRQLDQLAETRGRVEPADDPDTSEAGAPVNSGTWNSENKLVPRGHPIPRPGVQQGARPGQYANPDAPADTGADA